jgi:hypothetical protein
MVRDLLPGDGRTFRCPTVEVIASSTSVQEGFKKDSRRIQEGFKKDSRRIQEGFTP